MASLKGVCGGIQKVAVMPFTGIELMEQVNI